MYLTFSFQIHTDTYVSGFFSDTCILYLPSRVDALVSPPPEADFFAFSHRKYAISGVGWEGDTFRGLDTRVSPRGTGWPRECFVGGDEFLLVRGLV